MAGVKIENVTKRFGKVTAVDRVGLEIKDKEFVVFLGPSGCGKTTLLRCISGLETQDEGNIYIGDTLVNDLPPKDRDVAMVFQNYAVYPHMTVFDNLAFPLSVRKYSRPEIEKKVKQVTEVLNISHLLDRKPAQLSGGELQRTALGRAIVREPKVFLMDEPLSNLDAKLRVYMRVELKKLHAELGITTIYVTHDQAEAMTMGDRIAIMNKGKIQQVGSPSDVYFRPANILVATFLGSPPSNTVDCTFVETEDMPYLEAKGFRINISKQDRDIIKKDATSTELVLGIPPEAISVIMKKTHENIIPAEVYAVEPLGREMIVDLKVGDNLVKAITKYDLGLESGNNVWLLFDKDKIHIFDKKTEKLIY